MSRPGEIDACPVEPLEMAEKSLVKYKLHISIVFTVKQPNWQVQLAKLFHAGQQSGAEAETFSNEIRCGQFLYEDTESGDYLIEDRCFIVNEASPRAMSNVSQEINRYITDFCFRPYVEEVVPCILVPSFSLNSVIPRIFFNSYPILCLLKKNISNYVRQKINYAKTTLILYGFDTIRSIVNAAVKAVREQQQANTRKMSGNQIRLAALMSYYVYFYTDLCEHSDWSFLHKDLARLDVINKYFDEKEAPEPQNSFVRNVWNNMTAMIRIPRAVLKKAAGILFNYDGHLQTRIYSRIMDVVNIANEKPRKIDYIKVIYDILKISKLKGHPVGLYEFYELCGYWKYLNDEKLQNLCKRWQIVSVDKGFWSGYGALLLSDGKDYMYIFKGTDMDSYGRDWLLTNLLQGLTGFSLQHAIAVNKAKYYDGLAGEDKNLWFAGHSLGGGLASVAVIASDNRTGVTFNAAGLNIWGVKITQLLNHPSHILFPYKSWNRVTPYRIRGEVLDMVQQVSKAMWGFGIILERGYGLKSVDVDISEKNVPCIARHGINNFLYREVLLGLDKFEDTVADVMPTKNNKIQKVRFLSKNLEMEGKLA